MTHAVPSGPLAIGTRASVSVPATSANLGPGFDSFGLALSLHDHYEVEVTSGGLVIDVDGESAESVPRDESHLVARCVREGLRRLGVEASGLTLRCRNEIPHARGLGSSAAAIVGGLLLANGLVGHELDDDLRDSLLQTATEIEGHPDNVAACIYGGFSIAWNDFGEARVARIDVDGRIHAVACIPSTVLSTETARRLLPSEVSQSVAAANSARAGLLVRALSADPSLLLHGTTDFLHQDARASAMPDTAALILRLREAGLAAVVSGAGPTVLVLTDGNESDRIASIASRPFQVLPLELDRAGARLG
jgi:homoserine kinase